MVLSGGEDWVWGVPGRTSCLEAALSDGLRDVCRKELGRVVPRLAKDPVTMAEIEAAVGRVETSHLTVLGDSRGWRPREGSVDLVLTSPPYWTLKEYEGGEGQLGVIDDYEEFLRGLRDVWRACFRGLVPGGRLVCVVGDVCVSRRSLGGRHRVVSLHSAILEQCVGLGFDGLAPVIWYKVSNAKTEAVGGGGRYLGKPYEPNGVVKNNVEYILMLRKPGGYRSPGSAARLLSVIPKGEHGRWFRQVWDDVPGASTRQGHPAPFPVELAERLVRMFSFVGDVVVDPFGGSGTTQEAARRWGRNSMGIEVEPAYFRMAVGRLARPVVSPWD